MSVERKRTDANVAHHARASSVEVAIGFEPRYLAVRVRDDGVGIPDDVLAHGGKDGHFGMRGMRERAARIGGDIAVSSAPDGGSEVTLTLPARLAFARQGQGRAWWPRWLRRNQNDD